MPKKTLFAAASGAALLAVLAGCSSADRPQPSGSPSASASATAAAAPTVYDTCIDGEATILASKIKKDFTLHDDCKTVSIVGKGKEDVTITLPAVDLLVIEGDSVTATAAAVTKVVFAGHDNKVTHGGDAEVQDEGTGNTAIKQ